MIKFRMQKIKVNQFAVLTDNLPTTLNVETIIGVGGEKSKRIITINVKHNIVNENESIVLKLELSCFFEISPDTWGDFKKENDFVTIPKTALCYFASQAIGTSRGVLYCKTEGTSFENFVLQPINVDRMITNDIVL